MKDCVSSLRLLNATLYPSNYEILKNSEISNEYAPSIEGSCNIKMHKNLLEKVMKYIKFYVVSKEMDLIRAKTEVKVNTYVEFLW